jgi:hypothetical protein
MAQFNYKARKRSGEVVTGILEVADRGAALMQIERLGLFPVAVEMPKGAAAAAAAQAKAGRQKRVLDGFPAAQPCASISRSSANPNCRNWRPSPINWPICSSAACR